MGLQQPLKNSFLTTLTVYLLFFTVLLGAASFAGNDSGREKGKNTAAGSPTKVVKIIDPDNGPGTDYTSLDDFARYEKRDLVSVNEIAVALCRSSASSPDGPAQFYDWVTDT